MRYRPGGVRLWLGDHPYAKELASLGLPKRAMVSSSFDNVEMTFGDAQEISDDNDVNEAGCGSDRRRLLRR